MILENTPWGWDTTGLEPPAGTGLNKIFFKNLRIIVRGGGGVKWSRINIRESTKFPLYYTQIDCNVFQVER